MAANEATTMTVQAMGRMLGLKKTESYYLLHKHHFQTVTINHQLRVVRASFEQWYEHQDKYRKVDGPEPGAMLQTQFYSVAEIADMNGTGRADTCRADILVLIGVAPDDLLRDFF